MSSMNLVYFQIDKHEKSVLHIIQWIITVFSSWWYHWIFTVKKKTLNVHCFCNTEKTLFLMSSMNLVYFQIDKHEKSVLQIIQWIITIFDNGNRFYPKAHNTEKSRSDSVLCIFNDYSLLFQWFFSVIDNGNRFYPKPHDSEKSWSELIPCFFYDFSLLYQWIFILRRKIETVGKRSASFRCVSVISLTPVGHVDLSRRKCARQMRSAPVGMTGCLTNPGGRMAHKRVCGQRSTEGGSRTRTVPTGGRTRHLTDGLPTGYTLGH